MFSLLTFDLLKYTPKAIVDLSERHTKAYRIFMDDHCLIFCLLKDHQPKYFNSRSLVTYFQYTGCRYFVFKLTNQNAR